MWRVATLYAVGESTNEIQRRMIAGSKLR